MELISWEYLREIVGINVKWCNLVVDFSFKDRLNNFNCDIPLKFNNGVCGILVNRFELLLVPEKDVDIVKNNIDLIEKEELVLDNWDLSFIEEIPTISSSTYSINELSRSYLLVWDDIEYPTIKSGKYRLTSHLLCEDFEVITDKGDYFNRLLIGHRLSKDTYSSYADRAYYLNLFQLILVNKYYVITGND